MLLILLVALIVGGVLYYLSQVTLDGQYRRALNTVTIGEAAPHHHHPAIPDLPPSPTSCLVPFARQFYWMPRQLCPVSTFRRCEEGGVIWSN
ncbi:MAG: hypothetical protein IPK53_03255 [bacterium]|nr:hypothetical protein [bacterium]